MTIDIDTRRLWATYVELLQLAMGLQEWRIAIDAEPADDECEAQILPTYGSRTAALKIGPELHTRSARNVRATIVHELLHLHHAHPDQLAEQSTRSFGPHAYDAWELAMEYSTDAVARAWADRLPTPMPGLYEDDADRIEAHP